MSAFYILLGASIPIALGFLIAFIASAKKGQFDDVYTPSIRILMDDQPTEQAQEQQPTLAHEPYEQQH
jgi:cbb3-type cytochrome oxidase maturation protein